MYHNSNISPKNSQLIIGNTHSDRLYIYNVLLFFSTLMFQYMYLHHLRHPSTRSQTEIERRTEHQLHHALSLHQPGRLFLHLLSAMYDNKNNIIDYYSNKMESGKTLEYIYIITNNCNICKDRGGAGEGTRGRGGERKGVVRS